MVSGGRLALDAVDISRGCVRFVASRARRRLRRYKFQALKACVHSSKEVTGVVGVGRWMRWDLPGACFGLWRRWRGGARDAITNPLFFPGGVGCCAVVMGMVGDERLCGGFFGGTHARIGKIWAFCGEGSEQAPNARGIAAW